MKCIAYISQVAPQKNEASIPKELGSIYHIARNTNGQYGVTGMLSYRKSHYIQVIEGEDDKIDQLFANIVQDKRHKNVRTIFESPIKVRYFPDWNMKLVNSLGSDPYFKQFIQKNLDSFRQLPQKNQDLLDIFYTINTQKSNANSPRPSSRTQVYAGKKLSIVSWPDFTVVKQSPVIIELCAQLISAPHTYEELIASHEFGTQRQLDKILHKFEELDILRIADSVGHGEQYKTSKPAGSFYNKMRNFLGL